MGKPTITSLHERLQKAEETIKRLESALANPQPSQPDSKLTLLEQKIARTESRQRGLIGYLLEIYRWAYAWSKKQGYTKRLNDLKGNGESLKAMLEDASIDDINF